MYSRQLLLLLMSIVWLPLSSSWVYPSTTNEREWKKLYVVPLDGRCPVNLTCHLLSEYIKNSDDYFISNTTFYFLPGTHSMSAESSLMVNDITNLSLIGYGSGNTNIQCNGNLNFYFVNVTNLSISDIRFTGCGLESAENSSLEEWQVAALHFENTDSLAVTNVYITDSYGYGLFAVNTLGATFVHNCTFHGREKRVKVESGGNSTYKGMDITEAMLANKSVAFIFLDSWNLRVRTVTVNIFHSKFVYGNQLSSNAPAGNRLGGRGGLGIFANLKSDYNVAILNCSFHDNIDILGANIFLKLQITKKFNVDISNCSFYNGEAVHGGGMYIEVYDTPLHMTISDSIFHNNSAVAGGGMYFEIHSQKYLKIEQATTIFFIVMQCQFLQNRADDGAAIYGELQTYTNDIAKDLWDFPFGHLDDTSITVIVRLANISFMKNYAHEMGGSIQILSFTDPCEQCAKLFFDPLLRLVVESPSYQLTPKINVKIDIIYCTFTENTANHTGSAIAISGCGKGWLELTVGRCIKPTSTTLSLVGVYLVRNTANEITSRNAALYLFNLQKVTLSASYFIHNNVTGVFAEESLLSFTGINKFIGNRGYYGGGIHLQCDYSTGVIKHSLLSLSDTTLVGKLYILNNTAKTYGGGIVAGEECKCIFRNMPTIIMINNTAGIAGDSIYGGSLDTCDHELFTPSDVRLSINNDSDWSPSEISSNPDRVCFCDATATSGNCNCITIKEREVFPGETFSVLTTTAGQCGGFSPGVVRTKHSGPSGMIEPQQIVQELDTACANLTYTVRTSSKYETLYLYIESAIASKPPPSSIRMTFLPCPLGFELSGNPPQCNCAPKLKLLGIQCYIDTQTIHRPTGMWIGNYSGNIIAHKHCSFDYCKPGATNITLTAQDSQCALNHSGILCGECQPGLSLAFGTSQCLDCSNVSLVLMIPFILAGVALVFFLLKCNITVSTGTINGLIFYANIIRVNTAIFFPSGEVSSLTTFLSTFVAWVNLDLGIQTCFYDGMNAYAKTWLQFLFPAYVWLLIGVMIYSSRYSTTIAKLTGSNAVPVLATLLLLSYAKLLRTVITAVSPILITDVNETHSLHWLLDANILYLKGQHLVLFLMALLATLMYVVPFTLVVLLAPFLQTKSSYKLLRWVNRLKPLLDAYQGPYKRNFRYWAGFMVLVRALLFAVFAGNALGDPHINLFVIIIVVSVIPLLFWSTGSVYKKYSTQLLEVFYLSNLVIFTAGTQFIMSSQTSPNGQKYLILIMVGSTFVVFCITVAYHFLIYHVFPHQNIFQQLLDCYRKKYCKKSNASNTMCDTSNNSAAMPLPTITVLQLRASELREPMLSDSYNR